MMMKSLIVVFSFAKAEESWSRSLWISSCWNVAAAPDRKESAVWKKGKTKTGFSDWRWNIDYLFQWSVTSLIDMNNHAQEHLIIYKKEQNLKFQKI